MLAIASVLAFLIMLAATTASQPLATSSTATPRSNTGRQHRQQDAAPLEYG